MGGSRRIRRLSSVDESDSVVTKILGRAYEKKDLAVGEKNTLDVWGGRNCPVCPFTRNELWK